MNSLSTTGMTTCGHTHILHSSPFYFGFLSFISELALRLRSRIHAKPAEVASPSRGWRRSRSDSASASSANRRQWGVIWACAAAVKAFICWRRNGTQSPCPAVTASGRWCRNAPNAHVTHGTITRSFWYDLVGCDDVTRQPFTRDHSDTCRFLYDRNFFIYIFCWWLFSWKSYSIINWLFAILDIAHKTFCISA